MQKMYIARDLKSIKKALERESDRWVAVVDNIDVEITQLNNNVIIKTSDLEDEMFSRSAEGKLIDINVLEWLKGWPNVPIMDGKSIKELLEFRGTSLWWFGETNFLRTSYGDYVVSLKETVIRLETIKYGIGKYEPSQLYIYNSNDLTDKCSLAVCNAMNIPIELLRSKKDNGNSGQNELNYIMARKMKQTRHIFRCIISKVNRNKFVSSSNDTSPVMIFSLQRFIENIDLDKNLVGLPKDIRLYTLFEALEKRYGRLPRVMYVDSRYPIGLSTVRSLKAPAFPLELYSSMFDSERSNMQRELKQIWKKLVKSDVFKESLNYNGIQLWPLLKDNFTLLFIKQFPEAIECIRTMEHALACEKPQVILIINETGFYGRALLVTSQKQGIKSIGLQHGGISHLEVEYYHKGEGDILSCPISDIMTVAGVKDKERLLSYGLYNDENVTVTGSPKYDILYRAIESYSRDDVKKRYGIHTEKIIVITTMRFPNVAEREKWLKIIVSASKQIDAHFIIKPHPGEDNTEIEMHRRVIEKLGGKHITLVDRKSDTNELMYSADLTINAGSTTGLESFILGTPLLIVLLAGQERTFDSVKYGATKIVREGEDIAGEINNMLDTTCSSEIQNNIDQYVRDYAYLIDGKASDRIIDLVEAVIDRKGK